MSVACNPTLNTVPSVNGIVNIPQPVQSDGLPPMLLADQLPISASALAVPSRESVLGFSVNWIMPCLTGPAVKKLSDHITNEEAEAVRKAIGPVDPTPGLACANAVAETVLVPKPISLKVANAEAVGLIVPSGPLSLHDVVPLLVIVVDSVCTLQVVLYPTLLKSGRPRVDVAISTQRFLTRYPP